MKKVLYYLLLAVLIGVFAFSAYKIGSYLVEKHKSEQVTKAAEEFTTPVETDEEQTTKEPERISVDFDALRQQNGDVVAWLYGADTGLNYPVVQADDNDYYLYRLLDGSYNKNGTLFVDAACKADFSGRNTIIHGHHMRSGAMFGHLVEYKKQAFYDAHPYVYLMTPEQPSRVDLFAGVVVDYDAEIYQSNLSQSYLSWCMSHSRFTSDMAVPSDTDRILTLSTCSYEYDNARFVVLGVLTPVE